jgi:hypothetical protein
MNRDNKNRLIVAHFSRVKAIAVVSANFAMIVALYWLIFTWPGGFQNYLISKPQWAGFALVALPGSIWLLWRVYRLFFQIFFDDAVAIWIEEDTLIFTSKNILTIDFNEVDRFEAGYRTWFGINLKTITIYLRGERRELISGGMLNPTWTKVATELTTFLKRNRGCPSPLSKPHSGNFPS